MRYLIAIILLTVGTPDLSWSANCLLDSADTEVAANVGPLPAGAEVILYRDRTAVDTQHALDDGLFVTVADVLTPGESASYAVTVDGEDVGAFDAVGRDDCIEVQPEPVDEVAPPTTMPTTLPFTGLATGALLAAAAGLMFVGGGLVVVTRRKP